MLRSIVSAAFVGALLLTGCAAAPGPAPDAHAAVEYELAAGDARIAPFVADDDFMRSLTPADLSIRLHRDDGPSVEDLRQSYAANVREWNAAERARLDAAFARVIPRLAGLDDWLPAQILVVKVSEEFESGLPHTRGAAISLGAHLPDDDPTLDETLLHETFHVLSRANPGRRDELYGVLGFVRCTPLELPAEVRARIITNPDAPRIEHAAPIDPADPTLLATPLLIADPPSYDPAKPNIFQYFTVRMQPLRRDASGRCVPARGVTLSESEMTQAIFAHAGRNTDYIFHPEELLADNFAQMMLGRTDAPNPEIYDRLAAILGIARPAP